jgi:hypothetical protein
VKALQSVAVFVKVWQAEISIAFQNKKCGKFIEIRLGLRCLLCVMIVRVYDFDVSKFDVSLQFMQFCVSYTKDKYFILEVLIVCRW